MSSWYFIKIILKFLVNELMRKVKKEKITIIQQYLRNCTSDEFDFIRVFYIITH